MSVVDTIKAEYNGYTFEWGPNKYIVRMNKAGHAVWKRFNDRYGWFRRVDLTVCREPTFWDALQECEDRLFQDACDCQNGCSACSRYGD